GSYGLLGLYLPPARWRRALPAALLLVGVLPFGDQADTWLGFATRVATAHGAAGVLAALHVAALPAHTIILVENGVAHVDVPCSGVRGLWIGLLFFVGATLVERRALGLRWAAAGALYAALLLAANVARVATVVLLGLVAERRALGDVLHAPVGVLGFASASAIALLLLRCVPPVATGDPDPPIE